MGTSVSQILSKSFEMVKGRFGPLLGLFATYFAILVAMVVVFFVMAGGAIMGGVAAAGAGAGDVGAGAFGAGMILVFILFYVAYIYIACAQNASLTAMASPLRQYSFSDALSHGFKAGLPLLGVMVLLLIGYFVGALVFGLIAGVLSLLGDVGAAIALILFIPALVYLACRLALVVPVVAVEGVRNPIAAISRAWSLSQGNVLTIFLSLLVLIAIAIVFMLVVALPMMTTFTSAAMSGAPPSFAGMGFTFILYIVFIVAMTILSAAIVAVLHSELAGSDGQSTSEVFS